VATDSVVPTAVLDAGFAVGMVVFGMMRSRVAAHVRLAPARVSALLPKGEMARSGLDADVDEGHDPQG
jgi:hypothetical protein